MRAASFAAAPNMMRELLKKVLHVLLGDYHFWVVYSMDLPQAPGALPKGVTVQPVTRDILLQARDPGLRARASFDGSESAGFGLYVEGELAVVQWFWWGDRYWKEREGRSWILGSDEVKSLGLYTVPAFRGQGYATLLKRYTAHEMGMRGFTRVYSRIWHSHRHSIDVSRKAGWRKVGSYIEIVPFGRRIELRLPF